MSLVLLRRSTATVLLVVWLSAWVIWVPHAAAQTSFSGWWDLLDDAAKLGADNLDDLQAIAQKYLRNPPNSKLAAWAVQSGQTLMSNGWVRQGAALAGLGSTAVTAGTAAEVGAVAVGGLGIGWGAVEATGWVWCTLADYHNLTSPTSYPVQLGFSSANCGETVEDPWTPESQLVFGSWVEARHNVGFSTEASRNDFLTVLQIGEPTGTWNETYVEWSSSSNTAHRVILRCADSSGNKSADSVAKSGTGTFNTGVSLACTNSAHAPYQVEIESSYSGGGEDGDGGAGGEEWVFRNDITPTTTSGEAQVKTTVTCLNLSDTNASDGHGGIDEPIGSTKTITAFSDPWDLSYPNPEAPSVACPPGWRVDGYSSERVMTHDPDDQVQTIGEWQAPTQLDPANGDSMANCWEKLVDDDACYLMLHKVLDDGVTTVPCTTEGVSCAGWWQDPSRDTRYECHFGNGTIDHVVPLQDCVLFHDWPNVIDPTAPPVPSTDPFPYPDEYSQPVPDTVADPATDPGTETNPGTETDPGLDPSPDATPGLDDGCIPSWWEALTSWSIAKGTACVLDWAFTPSQTEMKTQLETTKTVMEGHVPFAYIPLMQGTLEAIPAAYGGTCDGYLWDLTPADSRVGYDSVREEYGAGQLAVPCDPPSWWDPVRQLMTACVIVGIAWGFVNLAGAAVKGPTDGSSDGVV